MNASEPHPMMDASRCQAALQAAMESVDLVAPDRWMAQPWGAAGSPLNVQRADGFLTVSATFPATTPLSRWELLKANANLAGLVKFCPSAGGGLSLRAEIPVHAENDLALRLAQACDVFAAAMRWPLEPRENPALATTEVEPPDLPALVEAAGWQSSSRGGDHCAVPLESRHSAHTALLSAQPGTVRACTELTSWDSLSPSCREGLSTLLLTANARIKLVRAVVVEDESGGAAQLEVLFQTPVSAPELRCALEALSVGANLCAPLADLLQQETAAELFLAGRDGPRVREDSQQQTKRKL